MSAVLVVFGVLTFVACLVFTRRFIFPSTREPRLAHLSRATIPSLRMRQRLVRAYIDCVPARLRVRAIQAASQIDLAELVMEVGNVAGAYGIASEASANLFFVECMIVAPKSSQDNDPTWQINFVNPKEIDLLRFRLEGVKSAFLPGEMRKLLMKVEWLIGEATAFQSTMLVALLYGNLASSLLFWFEKKVLQEHLLQDEPAIWFADRMDAGFTLMLEGKLKEASDCFDLSKQKSDELMNVMATLASAVNEDRNGKK